MNLAGTLPVSFLAALSTLHTTIGLPQNGSFMVLVTTGAMAARRVSGISERVVIHSISMCLELFTRFSHMELSETVCQKWTHCWIRAHISAHVTVNKVFPLPLSLLCQVVGNWLHSWLKKYVYVHVYLYVYVYAQMNELGVVVYSFYSSPQETEAESSL